MVVYIIIGILLIITYQFYKRFKKTDNRLKDYLYENQDNWAIVTGASQGIGKEFALQLAKAGFSIVLISRSKEKLSVVQDEIHSSYPSVKTLVIVHDFMLWNPLEGLDLPLNIRILVNNVAVSHDIPTLFSQEDPQFIQNMIHVNIGSVLQMTRLVLPRMDKKGLVLNVGSFTGSIPTGLLSAYGATKAFLKSFSISLYMELKSSGIHVQHLNTAFVVTNMSKFKQSSWLIPTPKEYVKYALKSIGDSYSCTPYPAHAWMEIVLNCIPNSLKLNYFYNSMVQLRQKALNKRK